MSRVCIHAERDGGPIAVDVALPSDAPVSELLPTVVDMVDDQYGSRLAVDGWRLDRLAGGTVDDSLSLSDNGVRDGELLVLTSVEAPILPPMPRHPCLQVAAAEPATHHVTGFLLGLSCVAAAIVAAIALAWQGTSVESTSATVVAGVGACAAAIAALTGGHPTPPSVAAVVLAAATGYLVVPSGPSVASAFLAAAAASSASLLMLRLTRRTSSTLIAAATLSSLVAVSTIVSMPIAALGVALSCASIGLLTLSPRLAVAASGLGPKHWSGGLEDRGAAGHATLTGLVTGCVAGTVSGAALVAAAGVDDGAVAEGRAAFAGLVAVVLLLRARTYVDAARRIALVAGGVASGIACFGGVILAHPVHTGWYSVVLVAIGVVIAMRPHVGATVSRVADRVEYAALAAVLPLALWVGGVFDLVRGVHLP